jgi:uncharacterized membrane protein
VIIGASWGSGSRRVFRWSDGTLADLGDGQPHGINNAGAVVGWTAEAIGWPLFVLQEGQRSWLEHGLGTGWSGYRMINDAGTVIGHRGTAGDDGRLWTAGYGVWEGPSSYGEQPIALGFPPVCVGDEAYTCSSPEPYAINNEGDVVGTIHVTYTDAGGAHREYYLAVIWSAGDYGNATGLPRGPGGSSHRFARGINDAGWIAGTVNFGRAALAALWIPDASGGYGAAIELPHAGSGRANAVSEPDEMGAVRVVGHADGRAALWLVDTAGEVSGPFDLASAPKYSNAEARAISTNGWIVGVLASRSSSAAVLWRPVRGGGDDGGNDGACTHPRGKCK